MENLDMTEAFAMEMAALEKAVETGKPVKLIFANGYQTKVVLESFDMEILICRKVDYNTGKVDKDHRWIVCRDKLSTIEV